MLPASQLPGVGPDENVSFWDPGCALESEFKMISMNIKNLWNISLDQWGHIRITWRDFSFLITFIFSPDFKRNDCIISYSNWNSYHLLNMYYKPTNLSKEFWALELYHTSRQLLSPFYKWRILGWKKLREPSSYLGSEVKSIWLQNPMI